MTIEHSTGAINPSSTRRQAAFALLVTLAALPSASPSHAVGSEVPSFGWTMGPILDGSTDTATWGRVLAIDGQRCIVGRSCTNFADLPCPASNGQAEVWEYLEPTGWRRTADLLPSIGSPLPSGTFGRSVALHEDLAIVGAPLRQVNGVMTGAVFVFHRQSDGTWTNTQMLLANTPHSLDYFGASLAFDGSVLIVGVPGRVEGGVSVGGITMFSLADAASFGAGVDFAVTGAIAADGWGWRVAMNDDLVVVSAATANLSGVNDVGAVATFDRVAGTEGESLALESVLPPPVAPLTSSLRFGDDIALDGDRLAVTSPGFDPLGLTDAGAAFLYTRTDAGWIHTATIAGHTNQQRLRRAAMDGDFLVLGSPELIQAGAQGEVRVFALTGKAPHEVAVVKGIDPTSQVGAAVAVRDGWWIYRASPLETIGWHGPRLITARLGDLAGDCDADGVPNGIEVTAEGAADCDHDGVPDACGAFADCDDSGTSDPCDVQPILVPSATGGTDANMLYWNGGGVVLAWLARIDAPVGGHRLVAVELESVSTGDGSEPALIAVYRDPTGSGSPANMVLASETETYLCAHPMPCRIAVPSLAVEPGDVLFVAVLPRQTAPPNDEIAVRCDLAPVQPGRTWMLFAVPPIDLATIGSHPDLDPVDGTKPTDHNLHCFGVFTTATDPEGDGILNACACVADLNGDGSVESADLALVLGAWGSTSGDLDQDGTTGAPDLAILLASWGPCGPRP